MKSENCLWSLLNRYHVVIPMIQRDYAQGRKHEKIIKIRKNLLSALFDTLKEDRQPLKLDFIYGYTKTFTDPDENQRIDFYPLDGQQRLTTLYLLHWYFAVKEDRLDEAESILGKFQYQTRHSAREFCHQLVTYTPENLESSLKEHIINQPWFFMDWKNEPTITGMMEMLDAIQEMDRMYDLPPVWDRLTGEKPPIIFYLLPMDQLGLADDLYIKMNARGKELTEFEHFKIKFSRILQGSQREEFNHKIDKEWSDLFWNLYKTQGSNDIARHSDEGIMRFFAYITDLFDAKTDAASGVKAINGNGEMGVYERVFRSEESVEELFRILDKMKEMYDGNIQNGIDFDTFFYIEEGDFSLDKSRLFFTNPQIDLFKKCADRYQPSQRINPFSIGEQLMLYTCIRIFLDDTSDAPVILRKIRNLISSSEDTLRKENIGRFLLEIDDILLGTHDETETKFNRNQLTEEAEKARFLEEHPSYRESIYRLEDHRLLQGCLGIFNLNESIERYGRLFQKLFHQNCNYTQISRALFVHGDYSQRIRTRWLVGGKKDMSWREFFFPSQVKAHYDRTKEVLHQLLDRMEDVDEPDPIIEEYLNRMEEQPDAEKPWYHYYIKYESFRIHQEGYYYWKHKDQQYVCMELHRKQKNGHHWDPYLLSIYWRYRVRFEGAIVHGNYGSPLMITLPKGKITLTSRNNGFHVKLSEESEPGFIEDGKNAGILDHEDVFRIKQTAEGLDLEDRIEKISELIEFGMS